MSKKQPKKTYVIGYIDYEGTFQLEDSYTYDSLKDAKEALEARLEDSNDADDIDLNWHVMELSSVATAKIVPPEPVMLKVKWVDAGNL